jgi:hypothetical protein
MTDSPLDSFAFKSPFGNMDVIDPYPGFLEPDDLPEA